MQKIYFSLLLFVSQVSFAQLLSFDFAGLAGSEATIGSTTNAAGILVSTINRGSGVTASANADRFNASGWTTSGLIDANDYVEFTLTPEASYSLQVSSVQIQHQRSGTGPVSFVIRTSLDAYTADATNTIVIADVTTTQTSVFTFTAAVVTTSAFTIRLYACSSESAAGTWGPGDGPGNDIAVNGIAAPAGPLPVRFSNLRASHKANGIEVSWRNETETDVVNYWVERSPNGRDFSGFAEINPKKNTGDQADYQYFDASPLRGDNLYRIKSLEINGKITYSDIVRISIKAETPAIALYPNPVLKGKQLVVQLTRLPEGVYRISVYNSIGQEISYRSLNHEGGSLSESLDLNHAGTGFYTILIRGPIRLGRQLIVQ